MKFIVALAQLFCIIISIATDDAAFPFRIRYALLMDKVVAPERRGFQQAVISLPKAI
ncbi:hypothetical protein [Mesorhizobium sp. ES1-4]|uniref:hypothetical protein n=1 Tax=Mesorhizobium sp. ES1-4 TaxID=2876627 RepID=UPI001CCD13D4|nr:hypothetical protein [Mesorhizobium sp. ES1-4]MBZ9799047.1 hypothetical protein [Mesorhizobium sp. ES1-4]